jgi:hypothetical protein
VPGEGPSKRLYRLDDLTSGHGDVSKDLKTGTGSWVGQIQDHLNGYTV